MSFHDDEVCRMVEAIQLDDHDLPTFIPGALAAVCEHDEEESYNHTEPSDEECDLIRKEFSDRNENQLNKDERILALTSNQEANGSFKNGTKIAEVLGFQPDVLSEEGRKALENTSEADEDTSIIWWTTVVVVTFLQEMCHENRDVWKLVVDKAEKWLVKYGNYTIALEKDKAKNFINKHVKNI